MALDTTGGRGIDHLVVCVGDIELARRRWSGLGFTVTPLGRHPWGTVNHLVQLEGNFVELLGLGDPAEIPRSVGSFSFRAFNQAFLDRRQGMSMLVFDSRNAHADQAGFAAAGLQTYPVLEFERLAPLPDGSRGRVGFSLAFVTDPRLPGLLGAGRVEADEGSLRVATNRGSIAVVTPDMLVRRFGGGVWPEAGGPESPRFAACTVAVRDLDHVVAVLQERGIPHERRGDAVGVGADYLLGLALLFVPAV